MSADASSAAAPAAPREPDGFHAGGIYLDYNATAPVAPEALEATLPYLRGACGNASSTHRFGVEAATAVERSRRRLARTIGAEGSETILFTGGGTEANNLALRGVAWGAAAAASPKRRRLLTFATEHPAILETLRDLARGGDYIFDVLPVDSAGRADLGALAATLRRGDTLLVSLMAANNEVGTIQPIAEAGRLARDAGALIHVDAVQALGKIPIAAGDWGADLITFSAHKIYAMKGLGALYVRPGTPLAAQITGGGQERGLRSGTENVPAIVSFGAALELIAPTIAAESARLENLREALWAGLAARLGGFESGGVRRNSPAGDACLAGTLDVSFAGENGHELAVELGVAGVACSSGSACAAGGGHTAAKHSHVLRAMGLDAATAAGAIRFSLGRYTTADDIAHTIGLVAEVVLRRRGGI